MTVVPTPFIPVANTDTERKGDVGLIGLLNGKVPIEKTPRACRACWDKMHLHERGGNSSMAQSAVLSGALELQLTVKLKSSIVPLQLRVREAENT